jgi:hypothetical protein
MSKYDKRLEGMRNNPKGDWKIDDVEALCGSYGIGYNRPNKGSHAKVSDPAVARILTVPYSRPIKPVYIKKLVSLVDDVLVLRESEERVRAVKALLEASESKGSKSHERS